MKLCVTGTERHRLSPDVGVLRGCHVPSAGPVFVRVGVHGCVLCIRAAGNDPLSNRGEHPSPRPAGEPHGRSERTAAASASSRQRYRSISILMEY